MSASLEQLLTQARDQLKCCPNADRTDPCKAYACQLARGILDLLGESFPCGFEAPRVESGTLVLPDGTGMNAFRFTSRAEACAYAAGILAAADGMP